MTATTSLFEALLKVCGVVLALLQAEFKVPKKPTTMSEEEIEAQPQDGSGSESEWEDDEDDGDGGLPSYEFRFECAKMLLELEDTTEKAIQVPQQPTPLHGSLGLL